MLIVINGGSEPLEFTLPPVLEAEGWTLLADTNAPERDEDAVLGFGEADDVAGRSVLVYRLA